MLLGLLKKFPGYTLTSLKAESAELMRLVKIVEMGGAGDNGQ